MCQFTNKNPKFFVSLSTVPERLSFPDLNNNIYISIYSLLNLNYDNYEIHLNIPYFHKKSGKEYIIPEWLNELEKNNAKLKIFRTKDFGPATKIAPTILRVSNDEDFILIVDDDWAYDKNMIFNHLQAHNRNPNSVIGFAGLETKNPNVYFCTCVEHDTEVLILEAYKGCSYKRKYFKEDFFTDFLPHSWNDDITLAAYIGKYNIKRIVARYDQEINFEVRPICLPIIDGMKHFLITEEAGCNLFRNNNDNTYRTEFTELGYLKFSTSQ
jgi:hypothetical protein